MLEHRLSELGRDVTLEPTRVRPNFGVTHLVHAVAGVVASVLSVYVPAAGLLLALVATASAFGDLTGSFHLVRRLTPLRASQNVVSDETGDKPGVIILAAHYDSPLEGMLQGGRLRAWPRALIIALGVITLCCLGRMIGINALGFTVIQFIPTVVLIAMTPLFADAALAEPGNSAADNAAGVAVALELADSHSTRLKFFDLMLALTGASAQSGQGMREWLRRHRKDLDPEATAVICLDNIAGGEPAYATKEGAVFSSRMHPTLIEIAREVGAESFESHEMSDAYLTRSAGLPTLRISTTEPGDPDALDAVREFTGRLLEQIDAEIGPELS
jgi:hypothetical protein